MQAVEVLAPAKVNLALAAGKVRDDGYHTLATLFQTVSLYDRVRLTAGRAGTAVPGRERHGDGRSPVEVRVTGPEGSGVPTGAENLVVKAYDAFVRHFGPIPDLPGLQVTLFKRIPSGAGLAGGSSDAAAVLRGLARWAGRPDAGRLAAAAAEVGSDVPYLLVGGTVAATGRGERLRRVNALPARPVVLVKPAKHLSTRDVYAEFDRRGFAATDPESHPSWAATLAAANRGDERALWASVFNDLEPAALALAPEIAPLLQAARGSGVLASGVSGSGSAVWATTANRQTARRLCLAWRSQGQWAWAGRLVSRLPEVHFIHAS